MNRPCNWEQADYGNWGGVGWSAGRWNNDPDLRDRSVPGINDMNEAFKCHDWPYQHGGDRDVADWNLVRDLRDIRPGTRYGKFYRLLAMTVFTVWPHIRRLWRKFA